MNKVVNKGAICLLLAAILLLSLTSLASAASQVWYLDSVSHSVTGVIMEKTGTQSGDVTVTEDGGEVIWLAGEAAAVDVTFSQGSWVIYLVTEENWGAYCDASIGRWRTGTGWDDIATVTGTDFSWESGILKVEIQTGAGTIDEGDYLGLKIKNTDANNDHKVVTAGSSYVVSPTSDPGYPVPELATGILLGVGLLGLVGYLAVRRYKLLS